MKTIIHKSGLLHVETPLGIINIRVGLRDAKGRIVDSVMVTPDHYYGEQSVALRGPGNVRLVQLKKRNKEGML